VAFRHFALIRHNSLSRMAAIDPVAVSREWLVWSTATADIGPPVAASLRQS
jgi:hypothetical protein